MHMSAMPDSLYSKAAFHVTLAGGLFISDGRASRQMVVATDAQICVLARFLTFATQVDSKPFARGTTSLLRELL
jgi:hypothetical protein